MPQILVSILLYKARIDLTVLSLCRPFNFQFYPCILLYHNFFLLATCFESLLLRELKISVNTGPIIISINKFPQMKGVDACAGYSIVN